MFYQMDSTRLPWRQYLHSGSIPGLILFVPILLVRKLFGIRVLIPSAIPDSLEPFLVDPAAIPPDVRAEMEPLEEEMSRCGFIDPIYHWIVDPFIGTRFAMATFRHATGKALGQIRFSLCGRSDSKRGRPFPTFLTAYADGTFLASTADPDPDYMPGPTQSKENQRAPGASVTELWRLHRQQIELEAPGTSIIRVETQESVRAMLEHIETVSRDYLLQRGILVPRTDDEQKTIESVMATPGDEDDRAFAAVYSEIQRQVNRKANATTTFVMLAVTVALFVALGRGGQAWKPLLLIIGVLFIHETGHLAAMRLFHYRNLRMFFIPLFGAAVTGQNYNAPGWKKAIVSLAGPLPGIALGAVLGIAAAILRWPTLMEGAMLLVAINGFNLLPVMPLDGGQIMHAVLFSRHPMIDVAFRAIAAVVLMLSFFIGLQFLAILGVFMLLGLPMSYRMAQVVHRLRQAGFDATSPDAQTIPVDAARRIHIELRTALPTVANAKASAQWTLRAFELLNAKPPGLPASIALIGVHGLSFLSALVILMVLFAARDAAFRHRPRPDAPAQQAARRSGVPPLLPRQAVRSPAFRRTPNVAPVRGSTFRRPPDIAPVRSSAFRRPPNSAVLHFRLKAGLRTGRTTPFPTPKQLPRQSARVPSRPAIARGVHDSWPPTYKRRPGRGRIHRASGNTVSPSLDERYCWTKT